MTQIMAENDTRHSQRAAAGMAKAIRTEFVRPSTEFVGPDGRSYTLGRPKAGFLPAFHKYNPTRRGAPKAKPPRLLSPAAAAAAPFRRPGGISRTTGPVGLLAHPTELLSRVPFMNLMVTAALVHRVWSFVVRRFVDGANGSGAAERQLARRRGEAEGSEADEDEDACSLDEREELLGRVQHASMLPTVLRASLPRQPRSNLARRAAQHHHSRPRSYRTAHQMMHRGPAAAPPAGTAKGGAGAGGGAAGGSGAGRTAQRRPLGKLEQMDLIVRQQIRAAMLAQQQHQLYGALPDGGPSAAPLPLPASAASALSGRNNNIPLAMVPHHAGPLGHAASAGGAPHNVLLPGALLQPGGPLPPPPFRPLPPELRSRLQGMPRQSAAAAGPARRAAAAGPPPLPVVSEEQVAGLGALPAASGPAAEARGGAAGVGEGDAATAEGNGALDGLQDLEVPRVVRKVRRVRIEAAGGA